MAHCDVEDVHSGGECADLTSVLHSPQADGSVLTTGYDDFVVRGNGNAPNLKKKERSFTITHSYNFTTKFLLLFHHPIFMDFLEGFARNAKAKYF